MQPYCCCCLLIVTLLIRLALLVGRRLAASTFRASCLPCADQIDWAAFLATHPASSPPHFTISATEPRARARVGGGIGNGGPVRARPAVVIAAPVVSCT